MREIKFRAWLKPEHFDGGKMFYKPIPSSSDFTQWLLCFEENEEGGYDGDFTVGEHIEIMQITGLKDKNGVDIYEGDIMKVIQRTVGMGKRTKYKDFYIPVEFHNGAFHLPFKDYGEYRFRDGWMSTHEVVGNIHEHSHLLKKQEA